MITTISVMQQPCHQSILTPPCPPDGPIIYDDGGSPELAFFIVFAAIAIGVLLQQTLFGIIRRTRYTQEDAREAAERVSAALEILPALRAKPLSLACRAVASEMLVIVDFILQEADHYCYDDPPEEEDVLKSIYRMRREALALRRQLRLTQFLLRFGARTAMGRRLTFKVAHRYVSVLMPLVRELHGKQSQWRENIPLFKINMPNGCHG